MAGFSLKDCLAYDEWQFFKSDELRSQLGGVLMRLSSYYANLGENETAIPHAKRWLALDPLDEITHRQLMRIYDQAGQRSLALRQYETCRQTLEEELGAEPSEETKELLQSIRSSTLVIARDTAPKSNLPAQATPFIGRVNELAEIRARLKEDGLPAADPVGTGWQRKDTPGDRGGRGDAGRLPTWRFLCRPGASAVGRINPLTQSPQRFSILFTRVAHPKNNCLIICGSKEMLLILDNFENIYRKVSVL